MAGPAHAINGTIRRRVPWLPSFAAANNNSKMILLKFKTFKKKPLALATVGLLDFPLVKVKIYLLRMFCLLMTFPHHNVFD